MNSSSDAMASAMLTSVADAARGTSQVVVVLDVRCCSDQFFRFADCMG